MEDAEQNPELFKMCLRYLELGLVKWCTNYELFWASQALALLLIQLTPWPSTHSSCGPYREDSASTSVE